MVRNEIFPESRMVLFISCPNVLKILTGTFFFLFYFEFQFRIFETETKKESSVYSFMEFGEVINEIIFNWQKYRLLLCFPLTKKYSTPIPNSPSQNNSVTYIVIFVKIYFLRLLLLNTNVVQKVTILSCVFGTKLDYGI